MSNYQRMIEDLVEAYESRLAASPDGQEEVHDEVLRRIEGKSGSVKLNSLHGACTDAVRTAFSQEAHGLVQGCDPLEAYSCSERFEKYISDVQYDLMRHCVILERALAVASAANPSYEQLSTGEWVS